MSWDTNVLGAGGSRTVPRVGREELEAWAGANGVVRVVVRWRLPAEAVGVLADVGLPQLDTRFVPEPQSGDVPLLPRAYVIGREEVEEDHDHGPQCSECGLFAIREGSGEVVFRSLSDPEREWLVNSSLRHLIYFIHKQGSATSRYEGLPDAEMMRRYEGVVSRLKAWDANALNNEMSFWKLRFARLWG